jgi:AcrR family transcriptional regulator
VPHRAPTRKDAEQTRDAVIAAALETILEQGYYRASSNEIARRAGVTWGVIQYYFGTREKLLLAALERGIAQFNGYLSDATVEGESLTDRLRSYGEILWAHFASQHFLASVQIIVNLVHDPETAEDTLEAVEAVLEANNKEVTRLLDDAVNPIRLHQKDRNFVFAAYRGVALDHLFLETFHPTMELKGRRDHILDATTRAVAEYLTFARNDGGRLMPGR